MSRTKNKMRFWEKKLSTVCGEALCTYTSFKRSRLRQQFKHIGSARASHPPDPGSNPGSAKIFLLNIAYFVDSIERLNPSSAYAKDFTNAVSGEGLSWVLKKVNRPTPLSPPPGSFCVYGSKFFCSTSLPLASTRWVQLTLSSLHPLF